MTDEENETHIKRQVAYEVAISLLEFKEPLDIEKGIDYKVADAVVKWLSSKGTGAKTGMMSSKAIREAIRAYKIIGIRLGKDKLTEEIFAKADEIFAYFTKN